MNYKGDHQQEECQTDIENAIVTVLFFDVLHSPSNLTTTKPGNLFYYTTGDENQGKHGSGQAKHVREPLSINGGPTICARAKEIRAALTSLVEEIRGRIEVENDQGHQARFICMLEGQIQKTTPC